jgi:four helix bundle protein
LQARTVRRSLRPVAAGAVTFACIFPAMAATVKDLKVWQEAVTLAGEVVRAMRQSARRETKAFTDQVGLTAVAIATGIADGYARYDAAEQRDAFRQARRTLSQLETQLAIARQAGLIAPAVLSQISARSQAVGRLLGGYVAYVERQTDSTTTTSGIGV